MTAANARLRQNFGSSPLWNTDSGADTLANLLKYAFAKDPSDPFDFTAFDTSGTRLTLTPRRVDDLTDLIPAGSDLAAWTDTPLAGLTPGQLHSYPVSVWLSSGSRCSPQLKVGQ